MTRSELAAALAKRLNISRRLAERLVQAFFEEMAAALRRGERIELRGFGSFERRPRRPYVGKNPRTGEKMVVPPGSRIRFRASKKVLARLNNDKQWDRQT